MAAVPVFGLAI